MARRVLVPYVSGGLVRGRPRLDWMDGVKVALGNRGKTVEAARQCKEEKVESPHRHGGVSVSVLIMWSLQVMLETCVRIPREASFPV